jgi:hypothetical protein
MKRGSGGRVSLACAFVLAIACTTQASTATATVTRVVDGRNHRRLHRRRQRKGAAHRRGHARDGAGQGENIQTVRGILVIDPTSDTHDVALGAWPGQPEYPGRHIVQPGLSDPLGGLQ